MIGFATIRKEGFPKQRLDQQRWRSLIGEFPELRRIQFIAVGSERVAAPDSAELIEDGAAVGAFIWDNGQIYVDGPYSIFPLAKASLTFWTGGCMTMSETRSSRCPKR
jgi:hypothetical protein